MGQESLSGEFLDVCEYYFKNGFTDKDVELIRAGGAVILRVDPFGKTITYYYPTT